MIDSRASLDSPRLPKALHVLFAGLTVGLAVFCTTMSVGAETRFVQGATSATITSILPPRAQGATCCPGCAGNDACPDCACWATSLGMIFSYWDDYAHGSEGPWESLLPGGDSRDVAAYRDCTQRLFDIYAGESCGGTGGGLYWFLWCDEDQRIVTSYTEELGYDFTVDSDDWVWFGEDVADEIRADRPLYYGYAPEGDGAHAVVAVGFDDSDETLWIYNTWDYAAHVRGFGEASNHCTLNITPGGTDCSSGPCCDGRFFMPYGEICEYDASAEYGCPWGTGCGSDVGSTSLDRVCSGESSSCDGPLVESGADWMVARECSQHEACSESDGGCRPVDGCSCECEAGSCCDGCAYRPTTERCESSPIATEYRCEGQCGGLGQRRQQFQYCNGSSPGCGGNQVWDPWEQVQACGPNELCLSTAANVACQPCPDGCVEGLCMGCTPTCNGRTCGADGCGGICGTCEADELCGADGRCEPIGGVEDEGCNCRAAGVSPVRAVGYSSIFRGL